MKVIGFKSDKTSTVLVVDSLFILIYLRFLGNTIWRPQLVLMCFLKGRDSQVDFDLYYLNIVVVKCVDNWVYILIVDSFVYPITVWP